MFWRIVGGSGPDGGAMAIEPIAKLLAVNFWQARPHPVLPPIPNSFGARIPGAINANGPEPAPALGARVSLGQQHRGARHRGSYCAVGPGIVFVAESIDISPCADVSG